MNNTTTNFNHPSWRRVISQLREIFNDLHEQIESNKDDDKFKTEPINLSEICLEANQKYITVFENELKLVGNDVDEEITESFRLILKVWKLCQIIFIKSSPSGALLLDLQEWYRSTNNIDPMIQTLFSSYSDNIEQISTDANYWILTMLAVAQGRIDTARHLLSFHPSKNLSVFRAVDEQLRSMPNFASLGHYSLFDYKAKWEYWQKKCIQVLNNENFSNEGTGSLEIICKMLCADENTFVSLKPIFDNWYYMLISLISFSNPTFNISDLHMHLASKTCIKEFEGELTEFDVIIHNIFDFDVEVVIKDCVQLFSNNLFSAHLLDILYLNGKLQLNKQDFGFNGSSKNFGIDSTENASLMHQQNLIDYGLQLTSSGWTSSSISMYQTAFDYWIKCKSFDEGNRGMELIETYLESISLTYVTELEANKVFHIAFSYGLHDLAFSIGRIMQTRALKRRLYGTSLGWNVRIKDPSFGTFLAEQILESFFSTGDFSLLELTENLSKEIVYCDRLIFLSKFREFFKLIELSEKNDVSKQQNLKQAGGLLVQLLESPKLVPFKYKKRVIFELRSLVKQKAFTEDQLFSIFRIIENYESRKNIFKEGKIFNQKKQDQINQADAMEDVVVMDSEQVRPIEIEDGFDDRLWHEFLNDITINISDTFVNSSIEV